MRKLALLQILVLLLPMSAMSQDVSIPKAEFFGGYSYLRDSGINLNGWNASIAGNITNRFGIVGDFGGHYASASTGEFGGPANLRVDLSVHSFLFGPRFSSHANQKLTPFVHALFGGLRLNGKTRGFSLSDTAFGIALGGGIDMRAGKNFAIRIVQADYLLNRYRGETGNSARLSLGIVFRTGNK